MTAARATWRRPLPTIRINSPGESVPPLKWRTLASFLRKYTAAALLQSQTVWLWVNGSQTLDDTEPDDSVEQRGLIGLPIQDNSPSVAWYKETRIREI